MDLAKHDPETEMEMNMTPMIDVVFLLIIFFMIITDLTQQDLEELQLPVARSATPDKPNPDEWRPILNIPYDGRIVVKRDEIYNPETDTGSEDPFYELKVWLADAAKRMEKAPLNDDGSGPKVPDEAVLIRADESTDFRLVQKVMEFCGEKNIQIWKVQLAAAEPPKDGTEE